METKEAKTRIERYCAYQDRSFFEAEEKLKSFGIGKGQIKKILAELVEEGFIDEIRFSRSYARGKFLNNKWGKVKIKQHLAQKKIPQEVVEAGLREIPDNEYIESIRTLIDKKCMLLDEPDDFIKNNKIAAYLMQKGFEPDLVWDTIRKKSSGLF